MENSSTTKIRKHILCGYLMSTIWTFDSIKNKHSFYHGEGCMKVYISHREHAADITNFEMDKM